jgi:predicted AlkP superfamily phosphohydrolase/phosphomutase
MKVLLVGMDGAHIDVFKRGWTPFISSLIEKGNQFNINNDLIGRGWSEIITGKHASITGAMYDNPKINSSYDWNFKFKLGDIPGIHKDIKPIWQVLNENGYSVGVMNPPTVFPAPKVNGFFVSGGGGGGGSVVEKPTSELCYPDEVLSILESNDYIVDERIVQLVIEKGLNTPDLIFNEMAHKNSKRTTSFIELVKKYKVDFGFVVYKTSSVLAETILAPEYKKFVNKQENIDYETINALERYYKKFDSEIQKLHESFPNSEIVFVSDHGTIARTHTVNLNVFLQQKRLQFSKIGGGSRKFIIESLKKITPFFLKNQLKKITSIKKNVDAVSIFDADRSLAFSHTKNDWNHGIYINDSERFGGPVESKDIARLEKQIIMNFNSNSEAIKHNLFAYSIKENVKNTVDFFPDILIDMPSGYLTSNTINEFIKEFVRPKGVTSLSSVLRGDIIAIKSHEPLAVDCGHWDADDKEHYDSKDLTIIYDLVLRKFGIGEERSINEN